MRTLIALISLVVPALASAVPLTMAHTGRLVDSTGSAVDGSVALTVRLYDGTTTVWQDTFSAVPVEDGYFTVVLGSGAPLEAQDFASNNLKIGVTVGANPEMPRQAIHSAAFALRADGVSGDVQVGASGVCAATGDAGRLRFDSGALQVCDGVRWKTVLATGPGSGLDRASAGKTCKEIHASYPSFASGVYWIDPDGDTDPSDAFEAWCDMSTNNGGWTLCLSSRYFAGSKPSGWAKNTWISTAWNTGTTVFARDYTQSGHGNFCPLLTSGVTEMYGAVTYNPASGWVNFTTNPITYSSTLFASAANGTFTTSGHSIGIDSNQRGIYGGNCDTEYTSNTFQNMQSLCIENGSRWQAQHTGWTCGSYASCSDSCNQPCYCTPGDYCGGSNNYERDIVMAVYLR
jgi:hypothetical protein